MLVYRFILQVSVDANRQFLNVSDGGTRRLFGPSGGLKPLYMV